MYVEMKIGERELKNCLSKLIKQKKIKKHYIDSTARYTLGEYSKLNLKIKIQNSKFKINRIRQYLDILSRLPYIKLVGLSGSVAMMNAQKTDDIDLFIISAPGRMWTARFLAVMTARILRLGRKRSERRGEYDGKVCLNLFFDGSDLALPKKKRTLYGAHEVLQMKPLIDKQNTYNRFLKANIWVFKIFPNALSVILSERSKSKDLWKEIPRLIARNDNIVIGNGIEWIFKRIQLLLIRRHQTTERITRSQLWFHPDDYEEKIGNHLDF